MDDPQTETEIKAINSQTCSPDSLFQKYKMCALVSGGKDSIYSLIECMRVGHEIVCIVHLEPPNGVDELDSYMFQTVGSRAVKCIAKSLHVPYFSSSLLPKSSLITKLNYTPADINSSKNDEIVTLYHLLQTVQKSCFFDAICTGAILSNYQRMRIESVCSLLHVYSFAPLWQREQKQLLKEMIDSELDIRLVKVASIGLHSKHLMVPISTFCDYLFSLYTKYSVPPCGEGGEYESIVFDSPLYAFPLHVPLWKKVIISDDDFAPCIHVSIDSVEMGDVKPNFDRVEQLSRLKSLVNSFDPPLFSYDHIPKFDIPDNDIPDSNLLNLSHFTVSLSESTITKCTETAFQCLDSYFDFMNLAQGTDTDTGARENVETNLFFISVTLGDMKDFDEMNAAYIQWFEKANYSILPCRLCISNTLEDNTMGNMTKLDDTNQIREAPVPCKVHSLRMTFVFSKKPLTSHIHIQSISKWAPATIGPYSQSVRVDPFVFLAGQIGLDPFSMTIVPGGLEAQFKSTISNIRAVCAINGALWENLYHITIFVLDSHTKSLKAFISQSYPDLYARAKFITASGLPKNALLEIFTIFHATFQKEGLEPVMTGFPFDSLALK